MKTLKLLIVFSTLIAWQPAHARQVDPSAILGDAEVNSNETEASTLKKITTKVKEWFKDDDSDSSVSMSPAERIVEERRQKQEENRRVRELSEQLPNYRSDNKGVSKDEISNIKKQVQQTPVVETKSPGRPGTSSLPTSKQGVPSFPFYEKKKVADKEGREKILKIKVKDLPLLDIGEEPSVSMSEFMVPELKYLSTQEADAKPLATPELMPSVDVARWTNMNIQTVAKAKDPRVKNKINVKPVTREMVDAIKWTVTEAEDKAPLPVRTLSRDEMRMLTVVILLAQGEKNCPYVLGLLDDLSEKKAFASEANFKLGVCAHGMKMYSESFLRLRRIIKAEHIEYTTKALTTLASDLPEEYEKEFYRMVKGIKNTELIPLEGASNIYYRAAKGAYKAGNMGSARKYTRMVSEESDLYASAQYLRGISLYSAGDSKKAEDVMEGLRAWMAETGKGDKNLASLTAANLARIHFNQGKYEEAYKLYQKVDKSHPLWVRALVEQGWAQLQLDDPAGAIGNMYSLHSPYFKAVYKPESYAVRTIGYLDICQYGDAYQTLSLLEESYRPWSNSVSQYMNQVKKPLDYYSTVREYLGGPSTKNVDQLPYQVIREIGRHKDFLNHQRSLNEKEDELTAYVGINSSIKKGKAEVRAKMKQAKERLKKSAELIKKSKTDKSIVAQLNQLKADYRNDRGLVLAYAFQLAMYEQSRQAYLKLKARGEERIGKEKLNLKTAAGESLRDHLKELREDLAASLDNSEFLRYEVFAGSGQNIRYQVAGGETEGEPPRIPASVKPEKSLNWSFKGEFWEDEIGSYRSTLKNNCPKVSRSLPTRKRERGNQASIK